MKILWMALMVTILFNLFEAAISHKEGTFSRKRGRRMYMSFLHNWAISFGDFLLFPVINALIIPLILGYDWYTYAIFCFVGLMITCLEHHSWWQKDENLGHVFASWGGASWFEDLTAAGLIHFIYMVIQVGIMALFIITPIKDGWIVLAVSYLFSLFLIVQNAQAFYIQGSFNSKVAKIEAVGVILVTVTKLTPKLF